MNDSTAVILTDSEESKMMSETPKAFHKILGRTLIDWVINTCENAGIKSITVIGDEKDSCKDSYPVLLEKKNDIAGAKTILFLNCDTPLISEDTIQNMLKRHREEKNGITVAVGKKSSLESDRLCGIYFMEREIFLESLDKVREMTLKGVTEAFKAFTSVGTYVIENETETLKIESRKELAHATQVLKTRINDRHMENGVTIIDPQNTYIEPEVEIKPDTLILPGCHLKGKTIVETGCEIGPETIIENSSIGANTTVLKSVVVKSKVGEHTTVGPFAYIRPDSEIGNHVKIGDFVEIKKSIIDDGTKVSHLTYIGDSEVGKKVNFGCGTVTVNYDGEKKYKTIIEDHAFIGCNTNLVAPVTVKENAFIAAGSTITDDVPENALAIARQRQINKENWRMKRKGGNK